MIPGGIRHRLGTGEILRHHENGYSFRVAGEKYALLRRREAASHHIHVLSRKKLSVAGGAVSHPPAPELLLSLKSHLSGMSPCGQQNPESLKGACGGFHRLHVSIQLQAFRLRHEKFRPEIHGLAAHHRRQLLSSGGFHPRIVYHLRGDSNLASKLFLLHHQNPVAGPGQIDGGGQARRPSAHHHRVVHVLSHNSPTRSRLGFNVSAPGCHLAGQTWSPCSATN